MDLDIETLKLAVDRIGAVAASLREIGVEELNRRNDLTAGRLATEADKLENTVEVINQTILKRLS
jgi:hypothetical protein